MESIKKFVSNRRNIRIVLILWGLLLMALHFMRIFDNNFWGDEYYSIHLGNMSFKELLYATSHDVHPPFYYMVLKVFIMLLGNYGWVYHFVSFLPFAIMIIACVTIVYDDFNEWTAFLLMSLCSMLYPAIHHIVEVRDYQWAALWMLLAFIYFKRVLDYNNHKDRLKKDIATFIIYSLLAAYSHYFCIIALVAIYVALMIYAILHREILKQAIIIWSATFLAYLPWCTIFFFTLSSNTDKIFSSGKGSIIACFNYLYDSKFSYLLLLLAVVLSVWLFISSEAKSEKFWVASGIASVLFTIAVPFIIEYFGAPILFLRNLYPVCPLCWLILANNITKVKYKNVACALLAIIIVPFGLRSILQVQQEEKIVNARLDEFLKETEDIRLENDNIIVTNEDIISPGLANYYYPGVLNIWYNQSEEKNQLIKENATTVIWLIDAVECPNGEEMRAYCESLGYTSEHIIENGFFGNYIADVWKCSKEE